MIRRVPDSPDRFKPVRRLRHVATALAALALLTAGGWKVVRPDAGVTMISRYLPSQQSVRAAACLEIAIALWLLSGRSPKLAPAVAGATFAGMALLVATELQRDQPLPCGCFPVQAVSQENSVVRRELSVALGRDAFLIVLCGMAMALAPSEKEENA